MPATVPLDKIRYVDHPEIKIDEHESTEMPFRYVVDAAGEPIFPEVSALLILPKFAGFSIRQIRSIRACL